MPAHLIDLSGKRFGRLVAVRRVGATSGGDSIWLFKCDCGNEKELDATNVKRGSTKACGCLRVETMKKQKYTFIHGETLNPAYKAWSDAHQRCVNPDHHAFADYGGRGITFSEEFLGVDGMKKFLEELGERPTPTHSVDRINNNRGYQPGNIRWATKSEQRRNQRPRK